MNSRGGCYGRAQERDFWEMDPEPRGWRRPEISKRPRAWAGVNFSCRPSRGPMGKTGEQLRGRNGYPSPSLISLDDDKRSVFCRLSTWQGSCQDFFQKCLKILPECAMRG